MPSQRVLDSIAKEEAVAKLMAEGKGRSRISRELDIPQSSVQSIMQRVQAAASRLPTQEKYPAPEGYNVKGTSTLIGKDGETKLQWIKTHIDHERFRAMVENACLVAAEDLQPIGRIKAPKDTHKDLCNLYTLTDCHVGMLAWGTETGAPWDLKIAEATLTATLIQMIDSAPPARVGIVNQLGDFLHFDSMKPITPEHGHLLDADSRYQKVVQVAVRILRRVIEHALTRHQEVKVYMHEGNHDPAGSIWLRVMLSALYERNPRVYVEKSPLPYVVYQHGKTLLAFHHGHLSKNAALPLLFAAKFPEQWGATTKRYAHVGHRHHVDEKEYPGFKVIQHPTLAAEDAYAARGGWISERQAMYVTYHTERGEIARGTFLPEGA